MLRKCCYCIGLRKACILIALLDVVINIVVLNIDKAFTAHIEQAVAICHCIGCLFLMGGALIRSTVLLMFYLITNLTNCLITTIYCIILLVNEEKSRVYIIPCSMCYVCVDLYFWVVVYSYYVQVKAPADDAEA